MFKKTIIAATALVASFIAFQPVEQAQARVNIGVHLGAPGYYGPAYVPAPIYEPAPVYVPAPTYYAPRPRYYAPRPRYYAPRVSYCTMARRNIRNHGYYRIRAIDCSGKRFTFHAKRGGQWFRLRVKAHSSRIYKVTYL